MDMESFTNYLNQLLEPESRKLVRVRDQEWANINFLPTGKLLQTTMNTTGATYTADVPELAPSIVGVANSLENLAKQYGTQTTPMIHSWQETNDKRKLELWNRDIHVSSKIAETLKTRLLEAALSAPTLDVSGRRTCRNCRGDKGGEHKCLCSENGIHYLGVLSESSDIIVDDPSGTVPPQTQKQNIFDPDCKKCLGTGIAHWVCEMCLGTGREALGLKRIVEGPDGKTIFVEDVAAWIRDGLATVEVSHYSINKGFTLFINIDYADLITKIEKQISAGQRTWLCSDRFFVDWSHAVKTEYAFFVRPQTKNLNVGKENDWNYAYTNEDGPFEYAIQSNDPNLWGRRNAANNWVSEENIIDILPTGKDILQKLQENYGGGFWQTRDEQGVERSLVDGLIESTSMHATIKIPGETLLQEMLSTLQGTGYGLGFRYNFIATGEEGPEVLLINNEDKALIALGLDYSWHQALASSYVFLPHVLEKLLGNDSTKQ
jgi:hypothetical protein